MSIKGWSLHLSLTVDGVPRIRIKRAQNDTSKYYYVKKYVSKLTVNGNVKEAQKLYHVSINKSCKFWTI